MVVSEKYKYVYLDNPKTATVSTVKMLLDNDVSAKNRIINIRGKDFWFKDHTEAIVLKKKLGDDYWRYKTFSFIRNPISKITSAYFFYKNGKPITAGSKNPWPARIRVIFARLLPFSFWAIIYPYRSNLSHLVDEKGKLIVEYIGLYERLDKDLRAILKDIGVDFVIPVLPHENKSTHRPYNYYLKNPLLKYFITRKLKRDLEFYNFIAEHGSVYKIKPSNKIQF